MDTNYKITTDNTADLPYSFYKENDIDFLFLPYTLEGKQYTLDNELPVGEFYSRMRDGSMPTTSQYNVNDVCRKWEPYLQKGVDILHIAFSSGLSGSYNSSRLAAEQLREQYPERSIIVVDTLSASMGEGMLVWYAANMKKEGKTLKEVASWLEENKLHLCHVFSVNDLFHLYRGGRVSKATAILGTMINIKPMLHVDNEGHLINLSKVRGRKHSIIRLADMMDERIGSYRDKNPIMMISHGDCLDEAELLKQEVLKRYPGTEIWINHVGATIGAHSGPGTMALFFLGDFR